MEDTTEMAVIQTTGLKGGASCCHRTKKNLFKQKEVFNTLKKIDKKYCEDCSRENTQPDSSESGLVCCTSCAKITCEEHAKKHCEAPRTGDPHAITFSLENRVLRCHPCDVDLEPLDNDNQDPVRIFSNNLNSFLKTKAETAEKKKEMKEEEKKAIPPPPPPPPSQPLEGKNIFKVQQLLELTVYFLHQFARGICYLVPYLNILFPNNDKKKNSVLGSDKAKDSNEQMDTMIPAKGLSNLGNTCFFNSVMQSIMHTHHLDYYIKFFGRIDKMEFKEKQTVKIGEEQIELEPATMKVPKEGCPLNEVVSRFLTEFRHGHSPDPRNVFSEISRRAPRFKGWQQQDAHELLRYLLDGLRSEEQERYKSAIADYLGVVKTTKKNADPEIVKKAKGYLQAAGRPLLDAVFGGCLQQTIRCCECGYISKSLEQFLDLSIPMSANPQAARLTAGSERPSSYKKKKTAKEQKKTARLQAKKTKKEGKEDAPIEENGNEPVPPLDEMDLSDDSGSDASIDDEDERETTRANSEHHDKTLVEAPQEYRDDRNIGSCLLEFTAEEMLSDQNSYECEKCCQPLNEKKKAKGKDKKRVDAVKRYLICEPPVILTLQLKRFQQFTTLGGRLSTKKLGGYIDFPLNFDIAPFCSSNVQRVAPGQKKINYALYAIVVHSGDLSGGHYIAYVKSRHRVPNAHGFLEASRATCVDAMDFPPHVDLSRLEDPGVYNSDGQWYYCSDSHVKSVTEKQVLSAEAYILFYERTS